MCNINQIKPSLFQKVKQKFQVSPVTHALQRQFLFINYKTAKEFDLKTNFVLFDKLCEK